MRDEGRGELPAGGEQAVSDSEADTSGLGVHQRDTLVDANELAKTVRPEAFLDDAPKGAAAGGWESKAATKPGVHVRVFGASDVGLVREHNEDNFLMADLSRGVRLLQDPVLQTHQIGPKGSLFAVCDGMGGAAAGEVASQMAVDIIFDYLHSAPPPADRDVFANRLVKAMSRAGQKIYQEANANRHRRGMGTTGTVAGLMDDTLFVAQVGDSRGYVLRNGQLRLVTKDQSLVNQLLEAGQLTKEEAEAFEHSNIILQALGTTEEVQIDLTFLRLRRGDRLLLCSDGLSGLVSDDMMQDVLNTEPDPRIACEKLIRMAHTYGGHDNVTVVAVDFAGAGLRPPLDDEVAAYQQYPLPPDQEREGVPATRKMRVERVPTTDLSGVAGSRVRASQSRKVLRVMTVAVLGMGLMFAGGFAAWLGSSRGALIGTGKKRMPEPDQVAAVLRPEESASELVEVRVRTDAEQALLFVDGERYGELPSREDLSLLFPPGAYQFEARSGGNVIAHTLVTIRPGVNAEVLLNLPSGEVRARSKRNQAPEAALNPDIETGVPEPKVEQDQARDEVRPEPAPPEPIVPPSDEPPLAPAP